MAVAWDEAPTPKVGDLLREWRRRRGLSQLELSAATGISTRHLSFVETGRSQPSRELLAFVAQHLDVPLRERNLLLRAAGYAPMYRETPLDDPAMARVRHALRKVLQGHEPYPALVQDRWRTLVDANRPTMAVLEECVAPALLEPPVNLLRVALHPEGLARRIRNFDEYAGQLVGRVEREVASSRDPGLVTLLDEVRAYPRVPMPAGDDVASRLTVPLELEALGTELRMFATIATFGTALDVTVDELTIESYFPVDDATDEVFRTHFA